ncbi:MAG TPA: alpha/beta fold hydrolase [Gemmatimonadaceae bacterium]|nr:alpha/beta fold hydrolase [Gemmatimonadaceae bacterium]
MDSGGVRLHVVRAGSGPAVVLLHGFPEFWYSWRHQIDALVGAGFSIAAPDLRGYNLSDKPRGLEAYSLKHLVSDVAAIARSTGQPRVHVVGHDWGGILAWTFASQHPDLVDRLVIMNAPHLGRFAELVRRPPQIFRSWYVFLFQIPGVAERLIAAREYAAVRSLFRRKPAVAGTFSREDVARYVEAISRPGALTAALNYYRALRLPGASGIGRRAVTDAEALVIWGDRDAALSPGLLNGIERYAPRAQVHRIPYASHWVQNEAAAEVNTVLLEFLQRRP